MSSPATQYRRRKAFLCQNAARLRIPLLRLPKENKPIISNEERQAENDGSSKGTNDTTTLLIRHANAPDISVLDELLIDRRSQPTMRDIAVTLCIFKVRRLFNNTDVDILCKLFRAFNVTNIPRSMVAIQELLHPGFYLQDYYKCINICSNCGSSNTTNVIQCTFCNHKNIFKFYLCSIKKQLQQLLSIPGTFSKLQNEKKKNIQLFQDTKYGKILQEIDTNAFTMIINTDGITTKNKNLSLWPFIFTLNELPTPDRRYLENVLIGGIVPTDVKPGNKIFKTCLEYIYEDLMQMESGQLFYIDEIDEHIVLYFYTIACCTDKPAEALMENVTRFNSPFGCPKCFAEGQSYHGERGFGRNKKHFTIRIYPFDNYELRTQEKCENIVQQFQHLNQAQVNTKLKQCTSAENFYGHLGCCPLTKLKYFFYGTSFLTDSLHTIYAGAFKKLLQLLFFPTHRREAWSLFTKIERIDELLSYVQTPTTTQRRFRSIKLISKFKGSEFRCLFHFGVTAILQCMRDNVQKNLLLSLVAAINLASADYVTENTIEKIRKLLNYFVKTFESIFGLRHMSMNIHSLLHVADSLKVIGPLWICSTFNYEGIDKDLVNTVHGTTEYVKQLIRHHVLYRDAIIRNNDVKYPMMLYTFNQELLNRKRSRYHYQNDVDGCLLPSSVSKELYDTSDNGIASLVQVHFKESLTFYHSLIISGVLIKTVRTSYAIIKSKQDHVRLFIEELKAKKPGSLHLNFKVNDEQYQLPNVFLFKRSCIFHLKHPRCFVKKHALIYKPGNYVTVLEYPNLKDNS